MTANASSIAASLGEKERTAILSCRDGGKGEMWLAAHCTITRRLWKKSLATYHSRPSRLTDLGLAVRAALLSGEG